MSRPLFARRFRPFGHRYHHGLHGCVIGVVGACQGSPALVLAGVALVAHDFADRRRWLPDLIAHSAWSR